MNDENISEDINWATKNINEQFPSSRMEVINTFLATLAIKWKLLATSNGYRLRAYK